MVMENHGSAPEEVDVRQILGNVEEVEPCQVAGEEGLEEEGLVSAVVSESEDFSQERLQRLKDGLKLDSSN